MLLKQGDALQYLLDVRDGKIKQGLGLDCGLDEHIKFKPKQLNIILGHDNVGKTYWINWYFLTLALQHDLTFCIWSGENQKGQILRDMVQMYRGKHFNKLSHSQIAGDVAYLEQYFTFIDNKNLYKPQEILALFEKSGCKVGLIDPFTGLDREMSFSGNYEFMNTARQFVNSTGMTIYINTHPNTESGRSGNLYTEGELKGHLKAPLKDGIEGGKDSEEQLLKTELVLIEMQNEIISLNRELNQLARRNAQLRVAYDQLKNELKFKDIEL